ncbi:MAG: hypothetical protein PHD61_05230 [Bacteroidales bacterium]|nr:hypothetical protein [Lentimicrobiaceae bacterium]MDD5694687.1 hypothetical protein [Bacteroidales bacterium]
MNREEFKKRLIQRCRLLQQGSIANTRTEMEDAQDSAFEHQPRDQYDSYRDQMMGKRDMFAKQLQQSLEQLKMLDKIDPSKKVEKVDVGAVILTGDQKIFVSIGIGKFEFENETWVAISPFVPFFHALHGHKKGDTVQFRDKKIELLDVF